MQPEVRQRRPNADHRYSSHKPATPANRNEGYYYPTPPSFREEFRNEMQMWKNLGTKLHANGTHIYERGKDLYQHPDIVKAKGKDIVLTGVKALGDKVDAGKDIFSRGFDKVKSGVDRGVTAAVTAKGDLLAASKRFYDRARERRANEGPFVTRLRAKVAAWDAGVVTQPTKDTVPPPQPTAPEKTAAQDDSYWRRPTDTDTTHAASGSSASADTRPPAAATREQKVRHETPAPEVKVPMPEMPIVPPLVTVETGVFEPFLVPNLDIPVPDLGQNPTDKVVDSPFSHSSDKLGYMNNMGEELTFIGGHLAHKIFAGVDKALATVEARLKNPTDKANTEMAAPDIKSGPVTLFPGKRNFHKAK